MSELKTLETSQIRLFHANSIPIAKLHLAAERLAISSLFNFETVEPVEIQGSLLGYRFTSGSYGVKPTLIPQMSIEDRKITIQVQGTSKDGISVYDVLVKKLQEFNDNRAIEEILCTHETICSAVLDVPFERVFSQDFLSFLKTSATKYTQNRWSQHYILLATLRFSVRFQITDEALTRNYITLSPKDLAIEPWPKTDPKDRLYRIASPTDTDTHIKLVNDFEKSLKGESNSKS